MEKNPEKRFQIDEVIGRLCSMDDMRHVCPARSGQGEPLLSNSAVRRITDLASRLMFPGFLTDADLAPSVMRSVMTLECHELQRLLTEQITAGLCFDKNRYGHSISDPAATSTHEVIVCYPGFRATMSYRIAHRLLELGVPIVPRMITEQAHSDTGIDIHPGAQIGEGFVIDHGTGVVIGATATRTIPSRVSRVIRS